MRSILIIILALFSSSLFGQNKYLSLGTVENGICFSQAINYNGIRINLSDRNNFGKNDLSFSGFSARNHMNGISFAFLISGDSVSNGLKIGGVVARANKHNGLAIGGLGLTCNKLNGVGISGWNVSGDTLNGLFIGAFGVASFHGTIRVINGFAIGLGVVAGTMDGVSVALFSNIFDKQEGVAVSAINLAKELHGFQFGLINCALNNRKFFRWTPLFNFNLRKKSNL